jgi:sRNA-binding carbon storage regulator CsrA
MDSDHNIGAVGLTLYVGEWIDIGDDIQVLFRKSRGPNACSLVVMAPKTIPIKRSNMKKGPPSDKGSAQ